MDHWLELTFKEALSTGLFPSNLNKGNIAPFHKKGDKQVLKNYRSVSLLPIRGKIFESLIFNELFNFFFENNLILPNQCGFKPGDSCINQLLSITHEKYNSFGEGLEVRSVFLDISKAFDKAWHKGLLFKLSQSSISGNLLYTFDLVFWVIENKEFFLMVKHLSSEMSLQAFLMVPFGTIVNFDIHKRFI